MLERTERRSGTLSRASNWAIEDYRLKMRGCRNCLRTNCVKKVLTRMNILRRAKIKLRLINDFRLVEGNKGPNKAFM